MPLPNVDTQDSTLATAVAGAAIASEMDKAEDYLHEMDYTLTSVFDSLIDLVRINERIARAMEGLFEIEGDRWAQETLDAGLALEAQREAEPQETMTGSDKKLDIDWSKVKDNASTVGILLATLAGALVAWYDQIPDWLKKILGIPVETPAQKYEAQRTEAEGSQERSLLGANEYIGPDFIGRAMDSYSSEMDFLRADEKRKNPNLSDEAVDYNAEQRRMGGVYRMDEGDNIIQVDSSFLEKYITGRDDPALQEYREKREKIESLIEKRNQIVASYETVLKEKQTLLAAGMSPSHPEYEKLVYKQNTIVERIEAVDQELKPLIPGAAETLEQTAPKQSNPKIEPKVEPQAQITPPAPTAENMDTLNTGSAASRLIDRSTRPATPSANPNVTKAISESGSTPTQVTINQNDNSVHTNTVAGGGGGGRGTGVTTPSATKTTRSSGTLGNTELTDFVHGSM